MAIVTPTICILKTVYVLKIFQDNNLSESFRLSWWIRTSYSVWSTESGSRISISSWSSLMMWIYWVVSVSLQLQQNSFLHIVHVWWVKRTPLIKSPPWNLIWTNIKRKVLPSWLWADKTAASSWTVQTKHFNARNHTKGLPPQRLLQMF